MDNVGSLRYSGRLFQTTGPDTVKARRTYVENLKGGTTSLLLLEDLRQWMTRRPGWRWNEQFIQVFRSSTVKTVIQGVCPRQFCLLWAPAQRKRATMLYFANVFLLFFLWPPDSPALVNGGSRKFYTWWTLSVIREVRSWILSWSPLNYRVGQKSDEI